MIKQWCLHIEPSSGVYSKKYFVRNRGSIIIHLYFWSRKWLAVVLCKILTWCSIYWSHLIDIWSWFIHAHHPQQSQQQQQNDKAIIMIRCYSLKHNIIDVQIGLSLLSCTMDIRIIVFRTYLVSDQKCPLPMATSWYRYLMLPWSVSVCVVIGC